MMRTQDNILVLFTRLPGYFMACLRHFSQVTQVTCHVVRHPADPLSPFRLQETENIRLHDREEMTLSSLTGLMDELQPRALLVSGWGDKLYQQVARVARKKGMPTVCLMDNQWKGTRKQQLAALTSAFHLRRRFTHIWVPGTYQYEYARHLGYPRTHILTGLYAADASAFSVPQESLEGPFPRRFLYVGHLAAHKGVVELTAAIRLLASRRSNLWDIYIIGKGDLKESLPDLPQVHHKDFMQPAKLAEFAREGGIFILPSRRDSWGVVVHEFALAGYPLIVSEAVGARDGFVRPGYNGWVFDTGNAEDLARCMEQAMDLPEDQLISMRKRSQLLGQSINLDMWASTLHHLLQSHGK